MRLIRFGQPGNEKPGILDENGNIIDVSEVVPDFDEQFFGGSGVEKLRSWFKENAENAARVEGEFRFGSPIKRPGKIVCIGLNYIDHARESKMDPPKEPIVFFKATSSITGPNDSLIIPKGSQKTDWEVELAIVIGKRASYVSEEEAMDHVFGYVLHNDYSERHFQLERLGQWVKGKSCDSFAPLGPFVATKDEIKDVHNLKLWLKVNGELKQNGNSSNLIFNVPFLVSYLSQFMSLLPGDIISTGTPAGVGLGFNPPQYLKEGDVVELGIDGLGSSKQVAISYETFSGR